MKVDVTLLVLVFSLLMINMFFGSVDLSFFDWPHLNQAEKDLLLRLTIDSRLPRTLMAFSSGAAMALMGLVLQTVFRNILAGPTTLGINAGASLGVASYYFILSSTTLALSWWGVGFFAILGALLFLTLTLLAVRRFQLPNVVLIIGLLLGYLSFAMIEVLVQKSGGQAAAAYMFWGMGSFNGLSLFPSVVLLGLTIGVLFWLVKRSNLLNLYLLGDAEMKMNGYDIKSFRMEVFIIGGVIIGMVTSLVGPIAFVGIAVPNLVKIIRKTVDHQRIGFSVFLLGGAFSVLADLLSRGVLFSDVLPVNAMQCILAFPVIVVLLFNKRKRV